MAQTSYSFSPAKAFSGLIADLRTCNIVSRIAAVAIAGGRAVFKQYGSEKKGRLPVENQCVVTDNAGTYTSGTITATVNGTAIAQTYDTDKNTTLTALAAAILAGVANVVACAYSSGSHTITIQTRNTALTVAISGTLGGTISFTTANTSLDSATTFAGVAALGYTLEQASDGTVQYAINDAVPVMEQGAIYVAVEETVTADDVVYVRTMADGTKLAGMFGKTSDSGKTVALTNCRFAEGGTTTVPAKLVINNP